MLNCGRHLTEKLRRVFNRNHNLEYVDYLKSDSIADSITVSDRFLPKHEKVFAAVLLSTESFLKQFNFYHPKLHIEVIKYLNEVRQEKKKIV